MPKDVNYEKIVYEPAEGYERAMLLSLYLDSCSRFARIRFTVAGNGKVMFVLRDLMSIVTPWVVSPDGRVNFGSKLRTEICAICGTQTVPKAYIYADNGSPTEMNAVDFGTRAELIRRHGISKEADALRRYLADGTIMRATKRLLPLGLSAELGVEEIRKVDCLINRPIMLQRLAIPVKWDCEPGTKRRYVMGVFNHGSTYPVTVTGVLLDSAPVINKDFGLGPAMQLADQLALQALPNQDPAPDPEPTVSDEAQAGHRLRKYTINPALLSDPNYQHDSQRIKALESVSNSIFAGSHLTYVPKKQTKSSDQPAGTVLVPLAHHVQITLRFGIKDRRLHLALSDLTLALHPYIEEAEAEELLIPWLRRVCNGRVPMVPQFGVRGYAMPMVPYLELSEFLSFSKIHRAADLRNMVDTHKLAALICKRVPKNVEVDIRALAVLPVKKILAEINAETVPARSKNIRKALAEIDDRFKPKRKVKEVKVVNAADVWAQACAQYGLGTTSGE